MLNLRLHPAIICVFLFISVEYKIVGAKTQFLLDSDKDSTSSPQPDSRLSTPQLKQAFPSQNFQDIQFGNYGDSVIHIIDPPKLTAKQRNQHFNSQYIDIGLQDTTSGIAKSNNANRMQNRILHTYPLNNIEKLRPSAALLIQSESPNGNSLLPPHQEMPKRIMKTQQFLKLKRRQVPLKLTNFGNNVDSSFLPENFNYHTALTPMQQFYPLQISAAVRHKEIIRTRPVSLNPYRKHRVYTKKLKTFQSKMMHDSSDFETETDHTQLGVLQENVAKMSRTRRDTSSRKKSSKVMRGSLLPVALTIMGENGELLSGRALLQHITVLLKNASAFEPKDEDDDLNQFTNGDVLLNEKDFNRIMKNSMNLTDPLMLTVLGLNAVNDSSLLTNTYVNEYLNCIDASKITNRFQALQTKIDCMKRKLFDSSNFDSSGSSRYSISNLPAALVYADVMSNIKNLVRPKSGIAFYSLPVDELTHLQQVVLPIEDFVSQIHNAHFAPRNYHNRKYFFNDNIHPRMPIFYIVKPDGRIYQTEGSRKHHPATIYHGFPDIPNADVYADGTSRGPYYDSMYYDE